MYFIAIINQAILINIVNPISNNFINRNLPFFTLFNYSGAFLKKCSGYHQVFSIFDDN